jgi:hypothetical protein
VLHAKRRRLHERVAAPRAARAGLRIRASLTAAASGSAILASTVALALAGPAQAATTAAIRASFSPNRLGARTDVTFSISFSGGAFGVPSPVRKAVVEIPAGLGLELPNTRGCTLAHLRADGAGGCPPRSQVGRGHAVVDVRTGATTEYEDAALWAFLGPLENGQPALDILGQGYTPIERRVAFNVKLEPGHGRYWGKLVALIPSIPSIPLEPAVSPVDFSVTIGSTRRSRSGEIGVFVPKHCPAGGFPWAAEFTYADGSTSSAAIAAPCPG